MGGIVTKKTKHGRHDPRMTTLRKACRAMALDDPEEFEGGCFDVSRTIGALAEHLGLKARLVCGVADTGEHRETPHAWLKVDGEKFDCITEGGGPKYTKHKERPAMIALFGSDNEDFMPTPEELLEMIRVFDTGE